MTEQELRIAKLSKIMNSGLRIKTANNAQKEAYERALSELEKQLQAEQQFNRFQEKKQKILEEKEREEESLKKTIRKHYFSVLQKQIHEKQQKRQIEENEAIREQELTDETYKRNNFKIKEMLDYQIDEKNRIKEELKKKEKDLDRQMLDLAQKSLDSEFLNKTEVKMKLQNELRESWEKTQNVSKLNKMIERSRRFGENFVIESENEDEDENKDSVLKRYEKTFGKIKDFENKNEKNKGLDKNNDSKRLKSKILRKRSKSMISEISTESQKIMIEKLMKLKQEEDKLEKKKKN